MGSPSNGKMRLYATGKRKMPPKPKVHPTTNTPFELIDITGNIRVCAGCSTQNRPTRNLVDGPGEHEFSGYDRTICIRHKEHDFVPAPSRETHIRTFDNKHYHVNAGCVLARNPHFNPDDLNIAIVRERMNVPLKEFLYERLRV